MVEQRRDCELGDDCSHRVLKRNSHILRFAAVDVVTGPDEFVHFVSQLCGPQPLMRRFHYRCRKRKQRWIERQQQRFELVELVEHEALVEQRDEQRHY